MVLIFWQNALLSHKTTRMYAMLASRSIQLSALSALLLCPALPAAAFSFADEEARDNAPVKRVAAAAIPAACKEKLKSERVLVLVAERGSQGFNADQERFGSHFMAIDKRLRKQVCVPSRPKKSAR
ncbi:MAG: hypothetical protein IPG34_06965 [Rhodocyclaceae bacterium]|nr:hypothetical protein [Rhodocyclaceae bacterium]